MAKQILDLRRNVPIVIETPEGLVLISKSSSPRHRGKLVIETPGDAKAYVGVDRALEHARFVTQGSDGRTVPTYGVIVPVKGKDGTLVGVKTQTPIRMAEPPGPVPTIRLAAQA